MQKDSLYCILFLHQTTTYIHGRTHAQGLYCILFLHQTTTANRLRISIYSLYCILFLHQTTTPRAERAAARLLYCILFLHQTTTPIMRVWGRDKLYCILFLHQTTTHLRAEHPLECCIASSFYIKPQRRKDSKYTICVVLHPLSTSNHNTRRYRKTTMRLYCILFLHQTTTQLVRELPSLSCIASSFYIKPQPSDARHFDFRALNSQ